MKIRRLSGAIAYGCAAAFAAFVAAEPSLAQDNAAKGIEQYRKMMAEDPFANPGNLYIDSGEALWKEKRGPNNVSLEGCDLGKGPGVLEGAFAELPRYFADADKVMDVESRILWCMEKLQGLDTGPVKKGAFSKTGEGGSEMEFLASYVGSLSNGMGFKPQLNHAKEKEAYAVGEALFYMRAGPHDFSCETCHGAPGTRIRLQDLPDLSKPGDDAKRTIATWPAYRVSTESVKTMQHRMSDCYRQMRMPKVGFGSDAVTALIVYLVKQAEGGEIQVPALKR